MPIAFMYLCYVTHLREIILGEVLEESEDGGNENGLGGLTFYKPYDTCRRKNPSTDQPQERTR